MKFVQILVYLITDISDRILAQFWKLVPGSYDFNEIAI